MWVNMNMLQWSSPSASLTLLGIVQMGIVFFDMVPNPLHLACTVTQSTRNAPIPSIPYRADQGTPRVSGLIGTKGSSISGITTARKRPRLVGS